MDNPWVRRLAFLTAGATLPLLFIGGLVTGTGAGLAVPDWPTTFGTNMILYPWSKMIGGIFYEHSHRLFAAGVGFLTLVLALLLWVYDSRPWVRWLGVAALSLVITQGVIGGLRVVLLERTLAIIHGSLAQGFFALMVSLALFTSREWSESPQRIQVPEAHRVRRLCLLTSGLIYLQGIFGAVLRYTSSFLEAHLLLAFLVAVHVVLLTVRILRSQSDQPRLVRPATLLSGLLILQLALGLGSYLGRFAPLGLNLPYPAVVAVTTSHVVTGALMLVTSLVLALRAYRLLEAPVMPVDEKILSEQVTS
jgi:cytochrome c oxidase assembly protein subunit 15